MYLLTYIDITIILRYVQQNYSFTHFYVYSTNMSKRSSKRTIDISKMHIMYLYSVHNNIHYYDQHRLNVYNINNEEV